MSHHHHHRHGHHHHGHHGGHHGHHHSHHSIWDDIFDTHHHHHKHGHHHHGHSNHGHHGHHHSHRSHCDPPPCAVPTTVTRRHSFVTTPSSTTTSVRPTSSTFVSYSAAPSPVITNQPGVTYVVAPQQQQYIVAPTQQQYQQPPVPVGLAVIKEGWLTKQGSWVKNWKRRWFILRGKNLSYFVNRTSQTAQGTISLTNARLIRSTKTHPFNAKQNIVFGIEVAGRTYYIEADGETDYAEWTSLLDSVINNQTLAVNPTSPVTAFPAGSVYTQPPFLPYSTQPSQQQLMQQPQIQQQQQGQQQQQQQLLLQQQQQQLLQQQPPQQQGYLYPQLYMQQPQIQQQQQQGQQQQMMSGSIGVVDSGAQPYYFDSTPSAPPSGV